MRVCTQRKEDRSQTKLIIHLNCARPIELSHLHLLQSQGVPATDWTQNTRGTSRSDCSSAAHRHFPGCARMVSSLWLCPTRRKEELKSGSISSLWRPHSRVRNMNRKRTHTI